MSRVREAIIMGIGILTGITLCGPAAQAATNLTATLSSQAIYVDGQQVSMTAYTIGGNNYVKLRDVAEAVDFNAYWDGKAVQIESDRPYTGEAPASQASQSAVASQGVGDGYLANGKLWHVTIALESPNGMNAFHYTDGNNGGTVYWPDSQHLYSREVLDCYGTEGKTYRIEAWTRYPESVPYTGSSANAWGT